MKRYEVVVYSWDIGTDPRMDFDRLADAVKDAKKYLRKEEYAAVYDREYNIAYVIFGDLFTNVFSDTVQVIPYC